MSFVGAICLRVCVCAAAVTFAAGAASADNASFTIPTASINVSGGGTNTGGSITLPGTGNAVFGFTFFLPRDYAKNTSFEIVIQAWSSASCTAHLGSTGVARRRNGKEVAFGTIVTADGTQTITLAQNVFNTKVFKVTKSPALPGQHPGDNIAVNFQRQTLVAEDNCGTITLSGVEVVYKRP